METVELTLDKSRTYFLVAGIVNALAGLVWILIVVFGGLATCGLGCILLFFPMIHFGVMVFDLVAAAKVFSPPSPQVYSFLKLTAALDIVAFSALVTLIMGVLNLELLARPEVYHHFHPTSTAET